MRSTISIICAVQDEEPVTEEELRLALLALSGIESFYRRALEDLVEAVEQVPREHQTARLIIRKSAAQQLRESMFKAIKQDPREFLGPSHIPGTEENRNMRRLAKQIFYRATGQRL